MLEAPQLLLIGMKDNIKIKSVTLIELLITLCLLGIITLMISTVNLFFWSNFNGIQRKLELQNDALFIISHIRKTALHVVGDANRSPICNTGSNILEWVVDGDANGIQEAGDPIGTYSMVNNVLSFDVNSNTEVVSRKVTFFSSQLGASRNNITVDFKACWNPSVNTCGKIENPIINVTMKIIMPMVSN